MESLLGADGARFPDPRAEIARAEYLNAEREVERLGRELRRAELLRDIAKENMLAAPRTGRVVYQRSGGST